MFTTMWARPAGRAVHAAPTAVPLAVATARMVAFGSAGAAFAANGASCCTNRHSGSSSAGTSSNQPWASPATVDATTFIADTVVFCADGGVGHGGNALCNGNPDIGAFE